MRTCFITYAYPPCGLSLLDLKPMCISDLRLETHHVGRVLLVRTFGKPNRILSVQNAIEDEKGDVDRLALYNSDPKLALDSVLPSKALFAIKEPYYKTSADGGYTVRVDHPSNLVCVPYYHGMVPRALSQGLSATEMNGLACKAAGNKAFSNKEYIIAVDLYTRGLGSFADVSTSLKHDLLRNRAIADLHLGRYENALQDALAAVIPTAAQQSELDVKSNSKALYRVAAQAITCRTMNKQKFISLKRYDL